MGRRHTVLTYSPNPNFSEKISDTTIYLLVLYYIGLMIMDISDYELVQSALSGDNTSFETIVTRYKNLVYSVVLRMVADAEDANDIAQEVFIKIYRNLDKYSPEFKFSTWVIRIATNAVIDFRRKKKQEFVSIDEMETELPDVSTPENTYLKTEGKQELMDAISSLDDMYKMPIILYHIEGMSYQEISSVLGVSMSKIKNRIFRGRRLLKDILLKQKEVDKSGL